MDPRTPYIEADRLHAEMGIDFSLAPPLWQRANGSRASFAEIRASAMDEGHRVAREMMVRREARLLGIEMATDEHATPEGLSRIKRAKDYISAMEAGMRSKRSKQEEVV